MSPEFTPAPLHESARKVVDPSVLGGQVLAAAMQQDEEALPTTGQVAPVFDRDTALQYYLSGASKAEVAQAGIDPNQVAQMIKQMPDDEREYVVAQRKEGMFRREAKETLMGSNSELFEGRVPAHIESIIKAAGFEQYAVGFNQSEGVQTITEATDLLKRNQGIELGIYNPDQRFLLHDATTPSEDYPLGYFGPRMGRFVYAIPVDASAAYKPKDEANDLYSEHIPKDLYVENEQGELVANVKYCAGFIDSDQVFRTNPNFMKDKQGNKDRVRERVPVAMPSPQPSRQPSRTY